MLESMLTLATAMLRIQTDLNQIRSMLEQHPTAPPTATATPSTPMTSRVSTVIGYANLARSTWSLLVWASGTKWGQTLIGFFLPLLISEVRWGWLITLFKRLLGFGG